MIVSKDLINRFVLITALLLTGMVYLEAEFAGGSGTETDPWQIATAGHLDNVRNYLGEKHSDKHFIQTADIDLDAAPWNEGEGWKPVGVFLVVWHPDNEPFTASYDGNNFNIVNLFIYRPQSDFDSEFSGLFGYTEEAVLANINLIDNCVTGDRNVGALVGITKDSVIDNCSSDGDVTGVEHSTYIGGLVGHNNRSTISSSYTTGDVTGGSNVGGIAGRNSNAGTIEYCHTTGVISGSGNVGGLVGDNDTGFIYKSYAAGTVTGSSIGGLVGYNYSSRIRNSYSKAEVIGSIEPLSQYVGGLVGVNRVQSNIVNCYAAGKVSGVDDVGGLIGQQMGSATTNIIGILPFLDRKALPPEKVA